MKINQQDLYFFREIVSKKSGLQVPADNTTILQKKLEQLLLQTHYTSFADFLRVLENASFSQVELREVFNFVTTQETFFFRLPRQFEYIFTQIFPVLARAGRTRLKFLSAGCATGEEAYSLAVLVEEWNEIHPDTPFEIEISAMDISPKAIQVAQAGEYGETSFKKVRGDPFATPLIDKFFKSTERHGRLFEVPKRFKQLTQFKLINLLDAKKHFVSHFFDLVLFRNVLIYLHDFARRSICDAIFHAMSYDSYLFLGETESPTPDDLFKMFFENQTYFFKKEFQR